VPEGTLHFELRVLLYQFLTFTFSEIAVIGSDQEAERRQKQAERQQKEAQARRADLAEQEVLALRALLLAKT
jgi:hypothetical protein